MKRLLEFKDYDGYKSRESKTRTKPITDEEFIQILKSECKNYHPKNDILIRYDRMDEGKLKKGLFLPSTRNTKAITLKNFFDDIENDTENYPVVRKKSLIGACGFKGELPSANKRGIKPYDTYGDEPFIIIPFDNSNIVFCVMFDLYGIDPTRRGGKAKSKEELTDMFIMDKYTRNFKVPTDKIKRISPFSDYIDDYGVEFFMSSPCLLINYKDRDWLYNLYK